MMTPLYQWIDLLALPIAWMTARKGHRLMAMAFALACVLTLQLQVEIMADIGHDHGFLGLLPYGVYVRGLCVYGFGIGLFLLLAWASPGVIIPVYMAAAIIFYFMMFAVSMLVMLI